MIRIACVLACGAGAGACAPGTTASPAGSAADAAPPASASATCDPVAPPDAAAFVYTASCAFGIADGGTPTSCEEWSEGPDGDWTPFVASCLAGSGSVGTERCPTEGRSGSCVLAPECTDQTTIFYFGANAAASGQQTCAARAGATFALTLPR